VGFGKTFPAGAEGSVITRYLVAWNDRPARDRHEWSFFGVGVIAMIEEPRVIAG
jgi:hypothetical protein